MQIYPFQNTLCLFCECSGAATCVPKQKQKHTQTNNPPKSALEPFQNQNIDNTENTEHIENIDNLENIEQ